MPEATLQEAERLYRRLGFAVGGRVDGDGDGERFRTSGAWTELEPSDDAAALLARAEEGLAATTGPPAKERLSAGHRA